MGVLILKGIAVFIFIVFMIYYIIKTNTKHKEK